MPLTKDTAHRKDLNAGIGDMQHRHFATIATIIREMGDSAIPVDLERVAEYFADRLRSTNPRFDRRRFLLACLRCRRMSAIQNHMDALRSGMITKTNVIGMRKAINHVERVTHGWSGNRSNATPREVSLMLELLDKARPIVKGELHDSGLKLLRSPRYKKRMDGAHVERIAYFRLIRFDMLGDRGQYATPVYQAIREDGSAFCFRNIPWQSGGDGPEFVRLDP